MDALSHRRMDWRVFIAPFVAAVLLLGFLVYTRHESPTHRGAPRKLSIGDLMLAATRAKKDIFLQYDGVTGPPGPDHTDHAPLLSVQWSVARHVTAGAIGAGRQVTAPTADEIEITKLNDKYSVPLFKESLQSQGAGNAIIYFHDPTLKTGPIDYLEIDLTSVIVSSFKMSSNGDLPTESITLNFTKITFKYQAPSQPITQVTWDLVNNVIS